LLLALAASAYYWPSAGYLKLNTAIALTIGSSLLAFLCLGALTFGRQAPALLLGLVYCLLALPLFAATMFALFVLVWSGAHTNPSL
jgi:hypothetical protein